jgi:hypothetical protein
VDDLNINEWVDKQLDKVFPTTQGYSREQIGDQWIIKQGGKTVRLEPGRIQQILHDAAGADTHFQAWMQQQQELGTLGTDYSKLDPAHLNMDQQVGSRMVGRKEVPTTLRDVIQPLLDKGMSFSDAMKLYQQSSIAGDIMDRAYAYGNKYIRNDVETEQGVSSNPYGLAMFEHQLRTKEQQEGQVLQLASTMTLGGADVKSAADFGTMQKQTEDVHKEFMQQYHDWLKDKRTTPDGKIWKQEDGKWVDVTADANQFRSQIQYADQQKQQMDAIDKAAQNASGYKVTSELKKKAQEAYDKVMNDKSGDIILPGSSMGTSSTAFNNKTKQEKAQMAYDNVIKNPNDPTYQRYQDELKRRMTGTTVGTDLFAFTNEKVVDALSGQLENMISGLGNDKGMVPVQIGSGANKGQQLSADDWNELKGKIKVIGTTISGDPSSPVTLVARAFKNVKGKKTEGEDMVIRLPNTNIASIAQQNMSPIQYYYMQKAAGIASSLNNFAQSATLPIYDDQGNQTGAAKVSKNNNDPRGGYTVTIGNEQRTVQSFKDIIDFMDQHK